MYRIYCDDKVLHDVRDEDYQLLFPKITLELNKTGSFDFSILPSHPHANDIKKLKLTDICDKSGWKYISFL